MESCLVQLKEAGLEELFGEVHWEQRGKTSAVWKKGLSLQNKPAGLHAKGFSISRDYSIRHSYTGFCYRRREKSWRVWSSRGAKIRGLCTSSFFYGTFQDVCNSDVLYPVGSSFDIGTIILEGKSRKLMISHSFNENQRDSYPTGLNENQTWDRRQFFYINSGLCKIPFVSLLTACLEAATCWIHVLFVM